MCVRINKYKFYVRISSIWRAHVLQTELSIKLQYIRDFSSSFRNVFVPTFKSMNRNVLTRERCRCSILRDMFVLNSWKLYCLFLLRWHFAHDLISLSIFGKCKKLKIESIDYHVTNPPPPPQFFFKKTLTVSVSWEFVLPIAKILEFVCYYGSRVHKLA